MSAAGPWLSTEAWWGKASLPSLNWNPRGKLPLCAIPFSDHYQWAREGKEQEERIPFSLGETSNQRRRRAVMCGCVVEEAVGGGGKLPSGSVCLCDETCLSSANTPEGEIPAVWGEKEGTGEETSGKSREREAIEGEQSLTERTMMSNNKWGKSVIYWGRENDDVWRRRKEKKHHMTAVWMRKEGKQRKRNDCVASWPVPVSPDSGNDHWQRLGSPDEETLFIPREEISEEERALLAFY